MCRDKRRNRPIRLRHPAESASTGLRYRLRPLVRTTETGCRCGQNAYVHSRHSVRGRSAPKTFGISWRTAHRCFTRRLNSARRATWSGAKPISGKALVTPPDFSATGPRRSCAGTPFSWSNRTASLRPVLDWLAGQGFAVRARAASGLLDQHNRSLSYVHVADEPADLIREIALLLDPAQRRETLNGLAAGSPTGLPVLEQALAAEAAATPAYLRPRRGCGRAQAASAVTSATSPARSTPPRKRLAATHAAPDVRCAPRTTLSRSRPSGRPSRRAPAQPARPS